MNRGIDILIEITSLKAFGSTPLFAGEFRTVWALTDRLMSHYLTAGFPNLGQRKPTEGSFTRRVSLNNAPVFIDKTKFSS